MTLIEGDFDPTRLPGTSPTAPEVQTTGPLKITGEQSIRTAAELHKALLEHVGRGPDLVVDLAGVQDCDATTLQMLYSLRKTADQRNEHFDILSVSPEVAAIAAALGLRLEALSGNIKGTPGC